MEKNKIIFKTAIQVKDCWHLKTLGLSDFQAYDVKTFFISSWPLFKKIIIIIISYKMHFSQSKEATKVAQHSSGIFFVSMTT